MGKKETSLLMSELKLLLAQKRTSLATLRTGIAVFVLPLTVLTILVSTSSYYSVWEVPYFIIPLLTLCIFLILVAFYLIIRAIRRIRAYDAKIAVIRKKDETIDRLISTRR